jgi:hypothetical protein
MHIFLFRLKKKSAEHLKSQVQNKMTEQKNANPTAINKNEVMSLYCESSNKMLAPVQKLRASVILIT